MADDIPYPTSSAQATGQTTARAPRRRWARGVDRPEYLRPGDLDRMMVMFVALVAEVSALRDRIDTHEALGDAGSKLATAPVEAYVPTDTRRESREAQRQAMLKRVLRAITEQREAALDGERPKIENAD